MTMDDIDDSGPQNGNISAEALINADGRTRAEIFERPGADKQPFASPREPAQPTAPVAAKPNGAWTPLTPKPAMAQEFLSLVGDDVMLFAMPPEGGGPSPLRGPNALRIALARSERGHNVYFVVNQVKPGVNKKPAKDDIETIRAVWADIDWDRVKFKGRFPDGWRELLNTAVPALRALEPQSTLIISTGGGFQPMWLIEPLPNTPENRNRAEAVGKYLAERFGGDAVENIDRILRLPGSINHPKRSKREAGQLTRPAEFKILTGQRYRLEDLETAWGVNAASLAKIKPAHRVPLEDDDINADLCDDVHQAQRDFFTCREIGPLIASAPNGPFSVRVGWVDPRTGEKTEFGWQDWLFVMRGMADDNPSLEDQCKQLFDEVSKLAGGDASENEKQWNATAGRKAQRLKKGDDITTVGTLMIKETVEPLLPKDQTVDDQPEPQPQPQPLLLFKPRDRRLTG
jgi:hypothetical protein